MNKISNLRNFKFRLKRVNRYMVRNKIKSQVLIVLLIFFNFQVEKKSKNFLSDLTRNINIRGRKKAGGGGRDWELAHT